MREFFGETIIVTACFGRENTDRLYLCKMCLINQPDNTMLISLLNEWAKDISKDNYIKVRREMMDGNPFLMLPAPGKNEAISEKWNTYSETSRIQLTSLYTLDGVKVLGAFTDPDSVLRWSKGKQVHCTSLRSQAVLEICERNGIKRVVINSGSNNIFPLSYYLEDEIQNDEEYW